MDSSKALSSPVWYCSRCALKVPDNGSLPEGWKRYEVPITMAKAMRAEAVHYFCPTCSDYTTTESKCY